MMTSTISLFSTATQCVQGNYYTEVRKLLTRMGARRNVQPEIDTALPRGAHREYYRFARQEGYSGWVDEIRCQGKLLQLVIGLEFSKNRWFSKQKKEWNELLNQAQQTFGHGHQHTVGDKLCVNFQKENLKILIAAYPGTKHSIIEIKVAMHQFCY